MASIVAAVATAALVATSLFVAAPPAEAATFTLTAARASSGTAAADAAGTCATQGSTATAHCAGYDVTLAATDQILRTGDSATVRFDFAFDGADTGVVLQSTLPLANGGAAAIWTSIPAACAAGSTRTDNNRTLTCLIANPAGLGDGSVTATLRLEPLAYDGYTFTVPATIDSATSTPVAATSTATFTASSAPLWDVLKNNIANTLPAPFFYRGPAGEPGFAFPSSTLVLASKVGGYSPLVGPVTWSETASSASIDVSGYRLLNWGNYGQDGCAADGTAALPAVPGYTSTAIRVSNQYSAVSGGQYDCVQSAPGAPVEITWTNPPAVPGQRAGNVWMMLWVPLSAIPVGTTPAPTLTASGFDPSDVNGVSNYFADTEPTANNGGAYGNIINADNRAVSKRPTTDVANPYASAFPGTDSSTLRNESFVSVVQFTNTGTVLQTPVQICDVFDVTTQRLSPYTANANVPADTYVVATTAGPIGDPITAPPYQPGTDYNNSTHFGIDPAAYLVEYAAGDLGGATPTEAPAPTTAFAGVTCADAGTATGWHTDPNDPAFTSYASSLGLSSPFDVINRVRVTFIGGAIEPGQSVAIKVHTTTRDVYRAATSRAGETIFATTRIGDVATYDYPQISIAPWTQTAYTGPAVAGRIGVDTNVVFRSVTPTTVQAGAAGQNRATYTLAASVAFGEDVATTQPLRVVYRLPSGMRYIAGSASIEPDHVLPQGDGSTIIVWDLGLISGTTNGLTTTPDWSFVAEADPLAPTPSTNWSTVVSESVSPSGVPLDEDLPIVSCGSFLDVTIPPTTNVPVETVTQVPPATNYSGCFGQGRARRMDYAGVTIGNAFLSLAALKSALQPLVESGADDGVAGAEVGWNLVYRNTTSNNFPGVDIIDVLPYPGDGRDPESDFSGTIGLSSLTTTDALSVTPNALPVSSTVQGPRTGTTFYVTDVAPADVEPDPYAASNLEGGSTTWCLLADVGDPGCPADLDAITAVRVISGELATGEEETVRVGLATEGASAGDILTNTATARVISVLTPVDIAGDSIQFEASSLSGIVWLDANADGVIDGSETDRLAGVDVTITGTATTSGDAVTRTVTSGADGSYAFPGLPAGSYTVTVDQASARAIDPAYGLVSDPQGAADGSFDVNLPLGTDVTGRNFGFGTSSLAGTVFGDDDNDGAIDGGESGRAGVTVTLTGTDDLGAAVSRTTTTDGSGAYLFEDVRPGDYQLVVTPPAGLFGGRNVPGTAGGTGEPVGADTISAIPLAAGENGVGYLFGLLEPEIIEGVVYEDTNDNGIRDAGEPGIGGVTMTLSGDADLVTQTLDDGRFVFAGLAPGDYTVTETQPAGYLDRTNSTNGSSGTVNGDAVEGIVVGGPESTDGYSFGELPTASIAGVVFDDLNANGVRDAGEPGIAGAQVSLSGDATAGPVTTDATGAYRFDGLQPGEYTITETEAVGYIDGLEVAGTAAGTVGTANGDNTISAIVLASGEDASGYLFGDVRPASITAEVFEDADGDGARDAGEPGIPGATVTLTGTDMFGDAVSIPGTTAGTGDVTFDALVPGDYVLTEDQPAGYFDGDDTAGTAGGTVVDDEISDIRLSSGTAASGYLFAELASVSIEGVVFSDLDGDGVQDAGESGIEGVTIELETDTGTPSGTTTTDADGRWIFIDLAPGTYTVTEAGQPMAGYVDGSSTAGTAGGVAVLNEISGIVLDGAAEGYAFAEIPLSIIRGVVWHDADDDGVVDADEDLLPGVEITLTGGPETRTATTGSDGSFLFAGLAVGTYTLTEEDLANWSDGATLVGSAGGDAGVNVVSDIVLGAGVDASGYGFGERAAELQVVVAAQTLDAQVTTGPYVAVGDTVRFTYTVTNNGDTSVEGLVVTDDVLGDAVCPTDELSPGASVECTLDTSAVAGQQMHTGTATADVVPSTAGPTTLAITQLTAADVAHYFGAIAEAEIVVGVDGEDAMPAPGPVFPNGTRLDFVVTITNTGNVPLEIDAVDPGALGALDCGTTVLLAPGESVQCLTTLDLPPGNYEFPLSASLTGPARTGVDGSTAGSTVTADASAFLQVLEPGVTPPSMANTGQPFPWGATFAGALILLLGACLLVVARRRDRARGRLG